MSSPQSYPPPVEKHDPTSFLLGEIIRLRADNRRLRRRVRLVEASRDMWRARTSGERWLARQARARKARSSHRASNA